jgi:hypothetical protein
MKGPRKPRVLPLVQTRLAGERKREEFLIGIAEQSSRGAWSRERAESEVGYVAQSIEKRLIGVLGSEMLRAAGHPPDTRLRAPGAHYRPSQAAREMQRAGHLPAKGTAR